MKKVLSVVLALLLVLTLIPSYNLTQKAEAADDVIIPAFQFPNEKYTKQEARVVSTKYLNLTGTINGVIGSSISYKVEQITLDSDVPSNSTEDITTGISVSGNQITVSNIQLFPGLNKITFSGVRNGTSFKDVPFYIEYRDSPILYDLRVGFETQYYDLVENGVTMLYSNSAVPQRTGNISIDGYAPNATMVTVVINGESYDYYVSQTSNSFRFVVPQLTINQGMNTITFKVSNGGQVIETTRQIALYTGSVTYFDEKLINDSNVYNLTYGASYSINNNQPTRIEGKAIIPLPLYDGNPLTEVPNVAADILNVLQNKMTIDVTAPGATITNPTVNVSFDPSTLTADSKNLLVTYYYDFAANALPLDKPISFKYTAPNLKETNESLERRITLRDGNKAFIADVNYLSGFDSSMTIEINNDTKNVRAANDTRLLSLSSNDIDLTKGAEAYTLPMVLEVLVSNYNNLDLTNLRNLVKLNVNGKNFDDKYKLVLNSSGQPLTDIKTTMVNGVEVNQLRFFLQINELDKSGTNELALRIDSPTTAVTDPFNVTIKLQYGPYVRFENIVDGKSIPYDSMTPNADRLLFDSDLKALIGRLMNVPNADDIVYETSGSARQTVFLYLNNVPIKIKPATNSATGEENKSIFAPDSVTVTINEDDITYSIDYTKAQNDIIQYINKSGENTVRFIFSTSTYYYESTIKFNLVPKNLPIIPAENTDGVYPYVNWPPSATDSNFTYSNGVYTTKRSEYNVYGTFDFIDLGKDFNSEIISKYNNIPSAAKDGFMIQISNPEWSQPIVWKLSNELRFTDGNRNILRNGNTEEVLGSGKPTYKNGTALEDENKVRVYYDYSNETFFFNIIDEKLPEDGSPMVYTITVFTAGESGPRATYRMEVNSISIPYNIELPVEENRIVNQNFVEVIITAPGAESMTINKQEAELIDYYVYSGNNVKTEKAFRAIVTLKSANKDIEIPFTIKRGDTTTTDSFTVRYVPTNIPGAQYMETMKSSHKVFNGALTLSFAKNTNLIRSSYLENTEALPTQVYNGNNILFAIAHPEDGIVDRHNFEEQAAGYSNDSTNLGKYYMSTLFENYAGRFIKASPLYWIDAGLADDTDTTSEYDPITRGLDPFPFPRSSDVANYPNFAKRSENKKRELVPSTPGTLTLSYDSNIVQSAGTTITVFRFDPYSGIWENIGGVVDEKKGTISVPFTKFGYYVVAKLTRSYNDIIDHSYAREAMEAVFAKGVMNAVEPVGRFGGDEYITRGEFTRMIVRALDLPLNYTGTPHFTYYPETITNQYNPNAIYDYRYIETAARAGIVNGTRPGFFGEDVAITRQDAAVILARALELKLETNATKAKSELDKAFKDGASFDYYAIPAVLAVQKQGFIVGKPINPANEKDGYVYDPKARMLRSDAAIIMARVMNKLKKLPKIYG